MVVGLIIRLSPGHVIREMLVSQAIRVAEGCEESSHLSLTSDDGPADE